ncbi:MAG TPA: hypothetical protein VIH21_09675 [Dehalococcoidia bacterium]
MTDSNSNGSKPRSEQLQAASRTDERAAARGRVAAFPYRFPRDRRQIGGAFTVEENSARLLRYFYFERRLAHALGSWTLAIPDLEVMLETGRHIFYHMDVARTLRERLTEQETRVADIDGFRDAAIDRFIDEMLSAEDTPELLVGVHLVAGRALEMAYRHHIDDTDPVTDAPTIRILKRFLVDYESMLPWAEEAVEAYVAGGIDESRLARWRWHLERVLGSIGGVSGRDAANEEPHPMRVDAKPYERGTVPMRDARFTTFTNTGDYDKADGTPRITPNTYEAYRLIFLRTQRDEVDAIEAFGTFLWDIRFRDFDAEYDLARITWDEARHTEIGHRALAAAGYEPFELPNRLSPSTCRGPMEPEYAMAEINLFGEVAILKTIGGLVDEARRRDDSMVAHIADFIRADERTHVRKGQHIIKSMTGMKLQELEYKTRELFTECLTALGAIPAEGNAYILTREEIERLVGE